MRAMSARTDVYWQIGEFKIGRGSAVAATGASAMPKDC
jgi:hypothetical protein